MSLPKCFADDFECGPDDLVAYACFRCGLSGWLTNRTEFVDEPEGGPITCRFWCRKCQVRFWVKWARSEGSRREFDYVEGGVEG